MNKVALPTPHVIINHKRLLSYFDIYLLFEALGQWLRIGKVKNDKNV